jgi:hypothetical protein
LAGVLKQQSKQPGENMPTNYIYRTPEEEAEIHAIYDQQLERLKLPYESRMVNTSFGNTLVLGPQIAPVRLSPRDDSYGQWLVEVLDALGLLRPAPCCTFSGG